MKKRWPSLLLSVFFLLTGCGFHGANYFTWWGQNSAKELKSRLDEGSRLFEEGDYEASAAVFQNLKETGNQDVIRPALYGLACSRLMLAKSKQEYLEAYEILELWQRISPPSLAQEDPRMLISLFAEEAFPPDSKNEAGDRLDSEGNFLIWFFNCKERIDGLEAQIANLEKEMTACEKQKKTMQEVECSISEMETANRAMKEALKEKDDALKAMGDELSKLRGQIKTLETIDQEIQEKKQGISSP